MKKLFALFFILILFTNKFVFADDEKGIQFEKGNWTEILSKAAKENKIVFLDAYASWCGPCKWMAKNVFTNDTVTEYYSKYFINAKIDMEKGEGIEIAKKYGVWAYPTFLYINGKGELIHRTCGSCPTNVFIQNGVDALNPETQLASIKKKFEANPNDTKLAVKFFGMMESACMKLDFELAKYFETQKESELTSVTNWKIMNQFLTDYNSREFKYLVSNNDKFAKLYSKDTVENKIQNVYETSLKDLIRAKDTKGYESLKGIIKKSGLSNGEKIILNSDLVYFQKNKDWNNYGKVAEKLANKYGKDDYYLLNNISWTVFENFDDKGMLSNAEKWAKHSTDLKDLYFNNDTYANILFKIGKKNEAKSVAEKAIELAKKEGADYKDTEELLNKINGK